MDPVNASTYNGAVSVVDDCCDCTTVCCSKIQQAYPPREKVILSLFLKKGRKFLSAWYKKFPWITLQRRSCRSSWSGLGRTTFLRVVGLVPRLHRHPRVAKYTCVYDVQLLAIYMMHSAACSSSAFQSSHTHGPIAKTSHHAAPPPPCTCQSHLLFAVARPLLKCRCHLCIMYHPEENFLCVL